MLKLRTKGEIAIGSWMVEGSGSAAGGGILMALVFHAQWHCLKNIRGREREKWYGWCQDNSGPRVQTIHYGHFAQI